MFIKLAAIMASPTSESVYSGQDSLQSQLILLPTTTTSILNFIDPINGHHQQQHEQYNNGVASITAGPVLGRENGTHFTSHQRAIFHM